MRKSKTRFSATPDFISGESLSRWGSKSTEMLSQRNWDQIPSLRFYIFYIASFVIFLIFMARLFSLTVVQGALNRQLADQNRVRLVQVEAERGQILDRGGKVLAKSQTIYVLKKEGELTEISKLQADELTRQGLAGEDFAGQLGQIERKVERVYTLDRAAAHVLGYTTAASAQDIADNEPASYQAVGRVGVEEEYNDFLTGKIGKKLVEVDASEKKVSILGRQDPTTGANLHMTVDSDLQKFAYETLAKAADGVGTKRGTVIISDPNTGEVLALASYPAFDPQDVAKSVNAKDKPFFNRAVQGTYPPGSIFKIVTALSGLESGKVTRDTEIEDTGQFEVAGTRFANWFFLEHGKTDGVIKIQRALARSNDIFFFRLAQTIGLSPIRDMAKKLGFGQKSGVDLPGESVGLIGDEVWKKSMYGEDWFMGDTMHMGIGQGFILATPMQMNVLTSFMATGKLMRPYLVAKIDGASAADVNLGSKVLAENLVAGANFDLVRAGMRDACEVGGTGAPFFNAPYDVGCKTGTAEKALGDPHAWFTVFAPYGAPKISVTVLVEDGGQGSVVAAPVAREIVDWWIAHLAR